MCVCVVCIFVGLCVDILLSQSNLPITSCQGSHPRAGQVKPNGGYWCRGPSGQIRTTSTGAGGE